MKTRRNTASALTITVITALMALPGPAIGMHTPASEECPTVEGEGGWGGTTNTCAFHCQRTDKIGVKVESSDEDAKVSGSAECGGIRAKCAALAHTCSAEAVPTKHAGVGECMGSSDEWWDSSLYVGCTSTSSGCIESLDPTQPRFCVGPSSNSAHVGFFVVDGLAAGWSCVGDACVPIVPTCALDLDRLTCWV